MQGRRSARQLRDDVDRLVAGIDVETRRLLAADPLIAIPDVLGIQLTERPESAVPRECPVDGSYFPDPPRISVAASVSLRRRNFTALHELGHHYFAEDDTLQDTVWRMADADAFEEDIADAFAAEILLPSDKVSAQISAKGPTARDVAELFERYQASREACCVRAAQHLRGSGYVVLSDRDGVVQFAARAATPYAMARGVEQPGDSLLLRAGRIGHARGKGRVAFASGAQTPEHHVDAVADGDYVFAVFTQGAPAWGELNILADDGPIGIDTICPKCGHSFPGFGSRCDNCLTHRCPECGGCGCIGAVTEKRCDACMQTKRASLFAAGDVCTDCA